MSVITLESLLDGEKSCFLCNTLATRLQRNLRIEAEYLEGVGYRRDLKWDWKCPLCIKLKTIVLDTLKNIIREEIPDEVMLYAYTYEGSERRPTLNIMIF